MTTIKDALVESIANAGRGIEGHEAAAAAILWTDPERLWSSVVDQLSDELDVLTIGDYDPDAQTGPAIWIRAQLAEHSDSQIPVVYLPGVAREQFRRLDDCPDDLKSLAELQFRGAFWVHTNGRDWTPVAFLKNPDRGLGVQVAADETRRPPLRRRFRSS